MYTVQVYYHDILRYTIIAGWEKVMQLRNEGFYVVAKPVPASARMVRL
jgi:hypothetical protein